MSLALLVYFIGILNSVSTLFGVGIWVAAFGAFMFYMSSGDYGRTTDQAKEYKKNGNKFIILAVVLASLYTITPSEKTAWMATGAYVAQSVYQSEAGDKVKQIIQNKLDEIIKEQITKPTK